MFRPESNKKLSKECRKIVDTFLSENPEIGQIFIYSNNEQELFRSLQKNISSILRKNPPALEYYQGIQLGKSGYNRLRWKDFAAIRILDYIKHAGVSFSDMNLRGKLIISNPLRNLWKAIRTNSGEQTVDFYEDMLHLFRQLKGKDYRKHPDLGKIKYWMYRYPDGIDPALVSMRKRNRERILKKIISRIDSGEIISHRYYFKNGLNEDDKFKIALEWWQDYSFHLRMAIRSVKELNYFLDHTLHEEELATLYEAENSGIPVFINPYYLSLLNIKDIQNGIKPDITLRDYIFANKDLNFEFGHIVAWEKEDQVQPNKPNVAGWVMPDGKGLHRRYPEVAIFIPETMGRSCGGLCVSCQRMYDFQSGHLNFNLDKLKSESNWKDDLKMVMKYFRNDSQLRDILVTGGDAFMSSDRVIKTILDHIYEMSVQKIRDNRNRPDGMKYAEMIRIRFGTRLPAYLPQRFTPELIQILRNFKAKASAIGIKQFIIQTHFVSGLEITPESRNAIKKLISAGWMVTNQVVFTAAASRRGHIIKLRKTLNDIGVIPYYTFQVKGHRENKHNFAPIARSVQEQQEEKIYGSVSVNVLPEIKRLSCHPGQMTENTDLIRKKYGLPFLATDRSLMNIPGVGKSLTFRVIGLTDDGRRILSFDHDPSRNHSPIIKKMGKVTIVESKSVYEYLQQLSKMGEDLKDYDTIYGYSIGETEDRMPIFEYPEYNFIVTPVFTNLKISKPAPDFELTET